MSSASSGCLLVALVLTTGCNQLYGLESVQVSDSAFYDAHTDAAPTCPAAGTLPRFSTMFQQLLIIGNCDYLSLSESAALILARCRDTNGRVSLWESSLDGPFVPAVGLQNTMTAVYDMPRLSPEGDLAIVKEYVSSTVTTRFLTFRREAGAWVPEGVIDPGFEVFDVSTPTRGPDRHVVAFASGALHELVVDAAGGWHQVTEHPLVDMHLAYIAQTGLQLSADGRRLLVQGALPAGEGGGLLYVDRAQLGDPFGHAAELDPVQYLLSGHLTEDCGRLYFAALGTVFFARRE